MRSFHDGLPGIKGSPDAADKIRLRAARSGRTVPHQMAMQHRPRERSMRCDGHSGKSAYADAEPGLTSIWELNLQSTGVPVSRGSYLSPLGQELAPWQLHQVAVASAGLSPQPLLISAAGYSSNERITNPRPQSRESCVIALERWLRSPSLAGNVVARPDPLDRW